MKDLKIGNILAKLRHKKGVTQDEVAEYVGVSKASVSKWETGQSYPDITILPHLATYYNTSIDELIGYHPQLSEKEIREKYKEFSAKFAERPFVKVMDEVRAFIRRYDSCYPLLFYMAQLYLNHFMLAASPEEGRLVLNEAQELCRRIQTESGDAVLVKDALSMEALLCVVKNEPEKVFELLGSSVRPAIPSQQFIANAYDMLGERERAMEYTQALLYQDLISMLDYLGMYLSMCSDTQKTAGFHCLHKLVQAFGAEQLLPHKLVGFYLHEVLYYLEKQETETALDRLEDYLRLAVKEAKNFRIHGDAFFDRLEEWIAENGLNEQMPRDIRLMQKDMVRAVTDNPAFSGLKDNPRFRRIEKQLHTALQAEQGNAGEKQK